MNRYPKIKSVKAIGPGNLLIEFDNDVKKQYNIAHLLEREMFSPLKDPAFFKCVHVEQGGYAVAWDDHIDISEYELWKNGQTVN